MLLYFPEHRVTSDNPQIRNLELLGLWAKALASPVQALQELVVEVAKRQRVED
jgi:hypothetical protein